MTESWQIVSFFIDIEIRPHRCDLRPTISLKWTEVKKSIGRWFLSSRTGTADGDLPTTTGYVTHGHRNTVTTWPLLSARIDGVDGRLGRIESTVDDLGTELTNLATRFWRSQ
ncbi:hypothetical protein [Microbacterium sp. UBA3486]|uniref:hypothetical protein n=1 Tax=Microbacterium TaxID=33882 RepID=UPI0025D742F8|nr:MULTISPECIES: hypothetical protein [Microbacterium]